MDLSADFAAAKNPQPVDLQKILNDPSNAYETHIKSIRD